LTERIWFRWLGVGGIELRASSQILAIDPFFTRPSFWQMWFQRVEPNRQAIAENLPECNFILVTHAHWDHIMDVPQIIENTRAIALGSLNVCKLLKALGTPQNQIREIAAGDALSLGPFNTQVLASAHTSTPIDKFINGPVRSDIRPPLRLFDYRMDTCFSFLVRIGDLRLLCREHPTAADVLFAAPFTSYGDQVLMREVKPRIFFPIHWDDFFSPLSKPIRPMFQPPTLTMPPLKRIDTAQLKRSIESFVPETKVIIPKMFQPYLLNQLTYHEQSLSLAL
jgi:L-ascorbate metabolism protein UlaG (beta-lactamase superfamily)